MSLLFAAVQHQKAWESQYLKKVMPCDLNSLDSKNMLISYGRSGKGEQ